MTPSTPFWKRLPFLLVAGAVIVVVIVLIANAVGGDNTDNDATVATVATVATGVSPPPSVPEAVPTATEPAATESSQSSQDASESTGTGTGTDATPPTAVPISSPITSPVTEPPVPNGQALVGSTLDSEGSQVRLNRVTPNTPPGGFEPDPGITITEIEVEACAGPGGFASNSFYWMAFLDDDTSAEKYFFGGHLANVNLLAGGCIRGTIQFEVPDGRRLASVAVTDALLAETGRWSTQQGPPIAGPLVPATPPSSTPVGEPALFGAGHTATVRSVTDATPPLSDFFEPAPGRQYSQLDVELCAGSESLSVTPLYWIGVTADNWAGNSALFGDTLPTRELAAGRCVAGIVEIDVPVGTTVTSVVLTAGFFDEVARWNVG